MQAVFTLDVENPHPSNGEAHLKPTYRILDLLGRHDIKATVFFVAQTAAASPQLVLDTLAAGHEIALHSLDHQVITAQSQDTFRETTRQAKQILENITGVTVSGYRAPVFSLTRQTSWAAEILAELGFEYSSSVLPGRSPLYGFPDAPRSPFRWPCGLVEFPAPVMPGLRLPYLGGIYLRYLPSALIGLLLRADQQSPLKWSYCHPYDVGDGDAPFRMAGVSRWANFLLMANRGNTMHKLEQLVNQPSLDWQPGFAQLLPELVDLPEFKPRQIA